MITKQTEPVFTFSVALGVSRVAKSELAASAYRELESVDSSPPEFAEFAGKEGLERKRSRPATGRGVESREGVYSALLFEGSNKGARLRLREGSL